VDGLRPRPGLLLHDLLGTGTAAYVLSSVYLLYLLFVPLSLGAALIWGRNVRIGSWYVTALCLNWLLGAVSYYLLPVARARSSCTRSATPCCPRPGVSLLQESLSRARLEVLADPDRGRRHRRHRRLRLAALLGRVHRRAHGPPGPAAVFVRVALWVFLLLTITATAYFGWHYLIDDVAGLLLGAASVLIAERVTRRAPTTVEPEPERELERATA
jgi:membrane-associated phospholipid phosphatase